MLRVEYEAKEAFIAQTEQTGNWESVKEKYLQSNKQGGEQQSVKSQTQVLKALVEYRDLVDFRLYRRATESVFPKDAYNIDSRVNGQIEEKGGYPRFVSSWYEFIVTLSAFPEGHGKGHRCIIKVNAPGSRNLTSDIDTSLLTKIEGDSTILLEFAPKVRDKGPDYAGRITNALIDGFYTLSEEEFGLTSGEDRDSNVYVDLSTNEAEEYPKFQDDEKRNPMVGNERLFNPEELAKKLAEYKLKKHRLELAASMFSLRVALGEEGWVSFKEQVTAAIQVCAAQLDGGTEEGEKRAAAYIKAVTEDLTAIFKQNKNDKGVVGVFAQTEAFFETYDKGLLAKKEELKSAPRKNQIKLDDEKAQERDLEVAALNRLYVEHLEKMIDLNGEILKLKHQNEVSIKKIEELKKNLEKEQKKLDKQRADLENFGDDIPEQEIKCATLRKQYEDGIKKLQANQTKLADLELEKLEARYQAHTFANEAYVCRSAVYHVVTGVQQGGKVEINQQTLLGSILQQIGFKLLHSQELLKRNKSAGEVAYRTAKYSQRIHQLIFEKSDITDEGIEKQQKSGRLSLLPGLKSAETRRGAIGLFTKEELLLLNREVKIITDVKNNPTIPETEKYARTEALVGKSFENKELFLGIAAKVLASTYLARFEVKVQQEQGLLWGGFSAESKNLQITYLLDKSKKRQANVLEADNQHSPKKVKLDSEEKQPEIETTAGKAVWQANNALFEGELDAETRGISATANLSGATVKKDAKFKTIAGQGFQKGSN